MLLYCWIYHHFWLISLLLNLNTCCQSALTLYYLLIDFVLINLFSWSLCYKLRFNLFIALSKTLSSFSTVVLIENHFSFGLFNIVMICHSITFVIEKYYLCCYDLWANVVVFIKFLLMKLLTCFYCVIPSVSWF